MEEKEIRYEIISDAGRIALLLPDLYISPQKVLPIYDKLTNKTLLDIQEWEELRKEAVMSAVG